MDKSRLAALQITNQAGEQYNIVVDGLSELAIDLFIRSNRFVILSPESTHMFDETQIDRAFRELDTRFVFHGTFYIEDTTAHLALHVRNRNNDTPSWQENIEIKIVKLIQIGSMLQSAIEQYVELDTKIPIAVPRLPQGLEIRTAYELANHYLNMHEPSYAELALQQFQKVIDKEPDFLPAYVGYAETAIFLVGRGYYKASVLYPKVMNMLDTMIRFKPSYGELYICKGIIDFFYTLDWKSTYDNIEKGLASYSEASKSYLQLSFFWYGMQNYEKALECIDISLEYNPLSVSLLNMKSDIYLSSRDYKSAKDSYFNILKINPNDKVAYEYLMFIALLEDNRKQAKLYKNKLVRLAGEDYINHPRMLYYYGAMGLHEEWKEAKHKIDNLDIDVLKLGRSAMLYAGIKDKDKLMYYVERAFNARTGILFILTDSIFDIIRSWSRYKALESQIIFPLNLSTDRTITIQSDLKESIDLNPEFILYAKSQEKYMMIYYYRHFKVQSVLLRMRLETLIEQLPDYLFWRSHRSYIINKTLTYDSAGNARGYTLTNRKYDFDVPVSRSKIGEMKKILK